VINGVKKGRGLVRGVAGGWLYFQGTKLKTYWDGVGRGKIGVREKTSVT